jgi:precorrin-3B C17-methyltransferase
MKHRNKNTPVGIVRNSGRPDEKSWITTLENLKNEPVDMFCVVIVGNSQTYVSNGRMITPRGYKAENI